MSEQKANNATTQSSPPTALTFEGECFCSAVAFVCHGSPDWSLVCHCSICARLSGASGVDLVAWKGNESIKITRGQDNVSLIMSSPQMQRSFCKTCGSPLLSTSLMPDMAFQDVPLSLFKRDPAGNIIHWDLLKPTSHIFYTTRVRNYVDDLPKWESYPGVGAPLTVDAKGNVVQTSDPAPPSDSTAAAHTDKKPRTE